MHRRVGRVARAMADPGMERRSLSGHCEVAARLAEPARLRRATSARALAHAYERWDGKGYPAGLAGDAGADRDPCRRRRPRRRAVVPQAGWETAAEVLADRRGRAYDPAVVDALVADGERWLAEIGDDACAAVLDAEPAPVRTIGADDAGRARCAAVADFADLKSPYFRGHSVGVAALASPTRRAPPAWPTTMPSRSVAPALVHDVGRVGVASGIWDRPGPLSVEQWERVRLHPYLTERVLHRCALLRRSPSSRRATTSAPTAPATTAASRASSSRWALACWPRPTPTTPCARTGPTGPR